MKIKALIFLFAILLYSSLTKSYGQDANFNLTHWDIFSSYMDIRDFALDKVNRLWCASNGGILIYDRNKTETNITYIGNKEGMPSLDITTIVYDKSRDVMLAGAADGTLQVINKDLSFKVFADIKNYGFPNPGITDIKIKGGLAYISGIFGIAVFDIDKGIFTETITKIGNYSRNTKVNKIYLDDNKIYAATEEGASFAPLNKLLSNPGNWTNIPAYDDTLKSKLLNKYIAKDVYKFKDNIYIINDTNILSVNAGLSDTFNIYFKYGAAWYIPKNLLQLNDELYFSDQFNIMDKHNNIVLTKLPEFYSKLQKLNKVFVIQDAPEIVLAVSFKDNGFGFYHKSSQNDTLAVPEINTPNASNYKYCDVDKFGNLWLASASFKSWGGVGISMMKPNGKWLNYTSTANKNIMQNNFFNVTAMPDGKIYSGNYGSGLYVFTPKGNDEYDIAMYNNLNSPFTGFKGDQSDTWVVPGQSKIDKSGDVWTVNMLSVGGKNLFVKTSADGTLKGYDYPGAITSKTMIYLEIDNAGTKWIASETEGIMYYNEAKNIYGQLSTSGTNLLSNSIYCLKIDKKGYLWVATPVGVNVILNPTSALNNGQFSIRKINFLNNVYVNYIYSDAIDNKWIATNQGIYVLNPDGSKLLGKFDTQNTPLKSNNILSIASNGNTGQIYITTDEAVYTAKSLSVKPEETYNITCYPQPFSPEKDNYLTIEGLAADNTLKIVTIEGRYIATIEAAGGRALWDGKDFNGKTVNNGIYLIIANEAEGGQTSVGKIAVEKNQ